MEWLSAEHYGIARERAIELEGNTEYPRASAAIFHFDKLTTEEKQTVLACLQKELDFHLAERKRIYQDARRFAELVDHNKYVMRSMNIHPYYKKQNRERIKQLNNSIEKLTNKIK